MGIKDIEKEEYEKLDYPILFSEGKTDRMYGFISKNDRYYKFAWQSTITKPKLIHIKADIYSVGIDLNFVMLDISTYT